MWVEIATNFSINFVILLFKTKNYLKPALYFINLPPTNLLLKGLFGQKCALDMVEAGGLGHCFLPETWGVQYNSLKKIMNIFLKFPSVLLWNIHKRGPYLD